MNRIVLLLGIFMYASSGDQMMGRWVKTVPFEDGLRGSGVQNGATGSPLAGRLFVVIGVGGAGKALAYGAKAKVARIVIHIGTYGHGRCSSCRLPLWFMWWYYRLCECSAPVDRS